MRTSLLVAMLVLGSPLSSPPVAALMAQQPIRLETRNGVLEVLGLKDWTVARLNTALSDKLGPDYELDARACAAFLSVIGMPDAEVRSIRDPVTGNRLWSVTIIEPGDSARSVKRRVFSDSLPDTDATAAYFRIDRVDVAQQALRRPNWMLGDGTDPALANAPVGQMLRSYIRDHRDSVSQAWARWTVMHDRNWRNRLAAVTALVGGTQNDSTYYVLAEAMRDGQQLVAIQASIALQTLTQHERRRVDWAPVTGTLQQIVGGTNLFTHTSIYEALAAIPPDRATGHALVTAGEELLLARLGASDPLLRSAAHQLLVAIAGKDLGIDPAKWRDWIRGLRPTSFERHPSRGSDLGLTPIAAHQRGV